MKPLLKKLEKAKYDNTFCWVPLVSRMCIIYVKQKTFEYQVYISYMFHTHSNTTACPRPFRAQLIGPLNLR